MEEPPPVQAMFVSVQPEGTVSVTVLAEPTWVPSRGKAWELGLVEVVAMEKGEEGATPLPVPAKPKVPVPPLDCLVTVREPFLVLVKVQFGVDPATMVTLIVSSPLS